MPSRRASACSTMLSTNRTGTTSGRSRRRCRLRRCDALRQRIEQRFETVSICEPDHADRAFLDQRPTGPEPIRRQPNPLLCSSHDKVTADAAGDGVRREAVTGRRRRSRRSGSARSASPPAPLSRQRSDAAHHSRLGRGHRTRGDQIWRHPGQRLSRARQTSPTTSSFAAPDLVALQEVTLYRRQAPSDIAPATPRPTPKRWCWISWRCHGELDAAVAASRRRRAVNAMPSCPWPTTRVAFRSEADQSRRDPGARHRADGHLFVDAFETATSSTSVVWTAFR